MAILFQDNFNRANQQGLGTGWTHDVANTPDILNNEANSADEPLDVDANAWASSVLAADMTVQCLLKATSTISNAMLVARRTATNTHYRLRLSTNGVVECVRRLAGVNSSLGTTSVADPTNFHTFRLEVFGDKIRVYRDNVLILGEFTNGDITGSGRGGINLSTNGTGRGIGDNFFISDTPGNIDPNQVDSDQVIPIRFKYNISSDLVIPIQFRYALTIDSGIPIEWDIAGLIRSDHIIPLQFRGRLDADSVIPITIRLPGGITVDFVIPIQMRQQLNVDQIIPILWKLFSDWIAQGAAQADTWSPTGAGQVDDWTAQGASQLDDWSPV